MKYMKHCPQRLENIIIKLLKGATITPAVALRMQLFLVYVERELGAGNAMIGLKKWQKIMRKIKHVEEHLPVNWSCAGGALIQSIKKRQKKNRN